jgi:hypothetical protein
VATTYTLRADGLDPKNKQAQVEVAPALTLLDVHPQPISRGQVLVLSWTTRSGGLLVRLPDKTERYPGQSAEARIPLPPTGALPVKLLLADPPEYPLIDLEIEGFGDPRTNRGNIWLLLGSDYVNGITTPGGIAQIELNVTPFFVQDLQASARNGKGATKQLDFQQAPIPFLVDQNPPYGSPNLLWSGEMTGLVDGARWAIRWRAYCPATP